ncbi:MAG TPA: AI-2E family transporter [Nostocaceae cyanobacterium]|nr:AI-2E family transporter [Nostocaceae cyanobacterium]
MDFSLNQLIKWLILTLLFPLICLNGWLLFKLVQFFQPLVSILVFSVLLAFILNYPTSLLEKWQIKRNYAVALVFISATLILLILAITVLPVVVVQFQEMVKVLPQWIDSGEIKLQTLNNWVFKQRLQVTFSQVLTDVFHRLPNELELIFNKLFSLIIDAIDSISDVLITIVLTFYLLIDGERISKAIFSKLPANISDFVQNSLQQNFQNYLIGQISLALLIGTTQTLMLLIFRVKFGLLFGLGIGILSLIPFGDVVSLIIITLIIASHNLWLSVQVLAAAVVIDQIIDQAIAPRLLSKFTGIRPIWVIISLLIGTYLGGIIGLLIAVPVAACIKDIIDSLSNLVEKETLPEVIEESQSSPV